jgi:SAM-dependent methyltransferase
MDDATQRLPHGTCVDVASPRGEATRGARHLLASRLKAGLSNLATAVGKHGPVYVARQLTLWVTFPLWSKRPHVIGRARSFTFRGRTMRYFYHRYNLTWSNERSVEIPIVLHEIERLEPTRMLEIGNVLAHYGRSGHDVIDKYEVAPGVRNEDVVDFASQVSYDLIVCVSTLEHVGWDEPTRDAGKIPRAIAHLAKCLAPGGRILVTLPLGYNHDLDRLLETGAIAFEEVSYLKRGGNAWIEASWEDVRRFTFDKAPRTTKALVVGTLSRDDA